MNRMRDKTHIILIILVLAFLATIVFEWGMNYLGMRGSGTVIFGSVNGQEIRYQDFETRMQQAVDQQKQQTGEDPDESMMQMIRDQVWDQMVNEVIIQQQIEKLGIKVTNQEILNWVYNSPQTLPDPIKKNFIDSTGNFNMSYYQQALSAKNPEVEQFWTKVEDYLRIILLNDKLQSVITGTVRVTEADALQKYKDEHLFATFNFIALSPGSIPDNQIQVSDDELKSYYDNNKDDFRTEESVKLKYVLFSDNPTAADSTATEKMLLGLRKELKRYPADDSDLISLVNTNSASKYNSGFTKPSELAPEVTNFLFSAKKDSVSDIIKASDGYHLVRYLDSKEGEELFTNSSHILINFGTDTNAAKLKAEQVYKRAKSGEDFSKLASEFSDDPGSKNKGGNLGWFTKGAMVKEFEDAVMNAKIGEIIGPVKTQFGFHIIKINDRQKRIFKVADIKKPVTTTTSTRDAIRKRAEDFTYIAAKGNFDEEAKKINMQVFDIPPITKSSYIPGAGQNKAITKFAFNENTNSISTPIRIQGGYAAYFIVEKIPTGYMKYDEIKEKLLLSKVTLQKKLNILNQKAEEIKNKIINNDLASVTKIDPQLQIQSADSFSVAKPKPQIPNDFQLLNTVFKLKDGQISEPIRTDEGYYIVQMKSITPFDEKNYQSQRNVIMNSLIQERKQTISQEWLNALRDKADILDNRDKYFR
ncbi:MAG: peptidylprolyl isomerase [Ignavibacteria bacterium]